MLTRSSAITAGSLVYDIGGALAISQYGRPRALSELRDNTFFGIFGVRSEGKVDRWTLTGEGEKR
jgi:hypothetical protein